MIYATPYPELDQMDGPMLNEFQDPAALFLGTEDKDQPQTDKLDDEALKRISDFKAKYEEMKKKAEENERELAYS